MTDSQIKALFAKQATLQRSVQGMKTQQGYLRGDIKEHGTLLEILASRLRELDTRLFRWQLAFVFVVFFYGTFILGQTLR